MSFCMMPLLIKVAMKKENYLELLADAGTRYDKFYLRKYYLFDGQYFSLDICRMDSFESYEEAARIAKYAEPTDRCVGLIYIRGSSYSFRDLYFQDGKCVTREPASKLSGSNRTRYMLRRGEILNAYPEQREQLDDPDIKEALTPEIQFQEYRCVGIELEALSGIFSELGYTLDRIDCDMGCVGVSFKEADEDPEELLAGYFGSKKAVLFCADGDQAFPNTIMILLHN